MLDEQVKLTVLEVSVPSLDWEVSVVLGLLAQMRGRAMQLRTDQKVDLAEAVSSAEVVAEAGLAGDRVDLEDIAADVVAVGAVEQIAVEEEVIVFQHDL